MKAVQILMEEELIEAVDEEARQNRTDRSKLVRAALSGYLTELRRQRMEQEHRRGYQKYPQTQDEVQPWEEIQEWPED